MKLLDDACVGVWRGRRGRAFVKAFGVFQRFYFEVLQGHPVFSGMTPSQLVEWQERASGREAYQLRILAQNWIEGQKRLRFGTKQSYLSWISSFFLHNHVPWPADPSFHFSSDVPSVEGKLTLEAFQRILLNSSKRYRAVFLMMGQGLMGEAEAIYVNVAHCQLVLESLTKNVGLFRVPLPGRKTNRNKKVFYTLLCTKSDWGNAMRDYLKGLPVMPKDALFRNNKGSVLTTENIRYYFHRRAVEAGVIKEFSPGCPRCGGETVKVRGCEKGKRIGYKCKMSGRTFWAREFSSKWRNVRYGVNPHEIRDLMRTRWTSSGANDKVAEYMMQHDEQVDPNEYLKWSNYESHYPLQEYRKALSWLNVLSEDPRKIMRSEVQSQLEASEAKVEALTREMVVLRRDLGRVEEAKELLADPEVLEQLKLLKKKIK